ncbi:uncharacterized protein [Lolium perenne]|uniref:uncharacterized protein n=1 Tax=Lolium perenne TaxID=4522 RepID=UPI0021F513C8|nr:uncharacterized protein LOC127310860 [Lolium perenne]
MSGVPREPAEHHLHVWPEANPVKQPLRRFAEDRRKAIASLIRFASRLGEKALPLYQLLKKSDTFVWSPQEDAAFRDLKRMLSTAPILASPTSKEPMLMYIAATNRMVSAVLVVEHKEEGKEQAVQRPVYYLSEVLSQSKQNYPHYQKLTYGVYMAVRKLKHYFQEHPIKLDFTASNNVAEYEALIHGLKLAKEIGVHRILCFGDSDLVIQQASGEWDVKDANMASYHFHVQQIAGFFKGCEFHHVPRANNEAADALSKIGSTRQAIPPGVTLEHLRKPSITPLPDFDPIYVSADPGVLQPDPGVPQSDPGASQPNPGAPQPDPGASQPNSGARQPDPGASQPDPGASEPETTVASVFEIKCVPSWAQQFLSYLADGKLPEDRVQASVSGVFQRCIETDEGIELLREIHHGECGHHASSRAIVGKAFRHGFYWPTALKDAKNMVRACNGCQRFAKKRHAPASALKTIPITWPFVVWGLDKFTKWIEAKPIKKLDGSTVVTFLKDIILRYSYPHSIITDNSTNFAQGVFSRFCGEKGIQMDLASVAHPESNRQVEKANGLILADIRPRLVEPLERAAGC